MANAMNLVFPPLFREWVVQHLLAHHWLYAMKKKFLMELIFILEMYLWQRMKERLSTEEGKSLKTEVVRGSLHGPNKN